MFIEKAYATNNSVVALYLQVHLNKLECCGKVHLFQ